MYKFIPSPVKHLHFFQCCGSVIFFFGTGPYADPGGPITYGSDSGTLVHYIILQRWKVKKKSYNSRINVFLTIFNSTFLFYFSFYHLTIHIITRLGIGTALTIFAWWWKDPEPDPYLWLADPEADPGGLKAYGSGSATLIIFFCLPYVLMYLT